MFEDVRVAAAAYVAAHPSPTPKAQRKPKKPRSRESLLADAMAMKSEAALRERAGDRAGAATLRAEAVDLERRARIAPSNQ